MGQAGNGLTRDMTGVNVPPTQTAIILVGQAARDHERVDAALTANVVVILIPSLQTASDAMSVERSRATTPRTSAAGNLLIDLTARRVFLGGRELPLTGRELAILAVLTEEPGRARTFAELAGAESGTWSQDKERVRSAVKRLRKKLAGASADARIEPVRGYGFRLEVTASATSESERRRVTPGEESSRSVGRRRTGT